jgi:hypothetical protein
MENCTTTQWKELTSPGEAVGELSDRLVALQDRLELYPPEYVTVDNLFMVAALALETLSHELWQLQKKDESLSGSPESKRNVAGPLFTHRDKGAE